MRGRFLISEVPLQRSGLLWGDLHWDKGAPSTTRASHTESFVNIDFIENPYTYEILGVTERSPDVKSEVEGRHA